MGVQQSGMKKIFSCSKSERRGPKKSSDKANSEETDHRTFSGKF
jgi:hypothetical protein